MNQLEPTEFYLNRNYPEHFISETKIKYSIPMRSKVTLKIYDLMDKEIETLVDEEKQAGVYELNWNAPKLYSGISTKGGCASGVYFYQIIAGEYISIKKMLLLK